MNLRNKPIRITIDGESKVYDSVREANEKTGIAYMTLMNWLRGISKPRIDIKVEPLSRYEKLLKAAMEADKNIED